MLAAHPGRLGGRLRKVAPGEPGSRHRPGTGRRTEVDRLTLNANIIETGSESYRLARTKTQKYDAAKYTVTMPRSS
jgi:hypothetical protein